jgi:hypothetical protein
VPARTYTNRRRHCTGARAYVHEYPGVGPRIDGVTAWVPGRACTSTRAEVHGCPACVHGRLAVAQERRSRANGNPRTSEALRTSFEKSTQRDGKSAVFASSHLRDVDAGANHARAWALTAAASPRKEERQS